MTTSPPTPLQKNGEGQDSTTPAVPRRQPRKIRGASYPGHVATALDPETHAAVIEAAEAAGITRSHALSLIIAEWAGKPDRALKRPS